jgi:hypothetical protein
MFGDGFGILPFQFIGGRQTVVPVIDLVDMIREASHRGPARGSNVAPLGVSRCVQQRGHRAPIFVAIRICAARPLRNEEPSNPASRRASVSNPLPCD